VGDQQRSVDDLDRAMGFILAAVADGHVGVDQARKLIRSKGVIPAAKQIRKATRDVRRDVRKQEAAAGLESEPAERKRRRSGKKQGK
jgi:hypothetical protein